MYYACVLSNTFPVIPHVDTIILEKRVLSVMEFIFFREPVYVTLAKISFASIF